MVDHSRQVLKYLTMTSDLPGLSSDWSSRSGRFVAPITKTPTEECRASSSASSWDTTLRGEETLKLLQP